MTDAALKVGRQLARDFGEVENLQVSVKGPGDFVSAADMKAEKTLVAILSKARPGYSFLLEEGGEIHGTDPDHRFIIDPLDGTTNFLHGNPFFATTFALEKKQPNGQREIIAAVTYNPISNELFYAEKGQGAFLLDFSGKEKRMQVSQRKDLQTTLLATGSLGRKKPGFDNRKPEIVNEISSHVASVRIGGSAALEMAYVAAGRLDGFWHKPLKPWDMAAGILLVREARGMVSEIEGGQNMLTTGSVLACNSVIYDTVRKMLMDSHKAPV